MRSIGAIGPATLCGLIPCTFLALVAFAQTNQSTPTQAPTAPAKEKVTEAINALKQGDFSHADIVQIADAGAVQAIPDLERQFTLTQDETSKYSIASALVRLGDKDPQWWDFLTQGAAAAIASDAPERQS